MKSAAFFLVVFTIGIITVFSANLIHDEKVRLFDIPTNSPILIEALTNVEPQMNVHLNSTKQYRWNVQKAVLWRISAYSGEATILFSAHAYNITYFVSPGKNILKCPLK
ncbi:hypothetical protein BLOT_006087 [Blomia tropicalis]|nr:hypothetical protein BLOT_006087 [Blomia tropicalis]